MSKDFAFSIVFPMLAVLLIAIYGGGLGVTFIVLRETIGVEAVVVLGSALVVPGADCCLPADPERTGGVALRMWSFA